jgi:hypothetical protein
MQASVNSRLDRSDENISASLIGEMVVRLVARAMTDLLGLGLVR